jgi:hypothetical protein
MNPRSFAALLRLLPAWLLAGLALGQVPPTATPLRSELSRGAALFREGPRVWITPETVAGAGSVHLPRFCAAIRSLAWVDAAGDVQLVPEPAHWVVSWKQAPAHARTLLLTFDTDALLPGELKPAAPAGDGSITLPAYQAATHGEKLRYEPQPHKNTVGYWTVPGDTASWEFTAAAAGTYSLGVLQGCGEGQGGSRVRLELTAGDRVVAAQEFEALETGHFQNFRWRHLGHVSLPAPGAYRLTLRPLKLARAAVFDVRTLQLVPQAKPGP